MLEILTNLIQEHPVIIRAVGLGAFIAGDYLPDILDYAKRKKLGVRLRYSYRRMRDDDIYE